jgi:hypothetical protein
MNANAADLPPSTVTGTLSITGLQAASRKEIRHFTGDGEVNERIEAGPAHFF